MPSENKNYEKKKSRVSFDMCHGTTDGSQRHAHRPPHLADAFLGPKIFFCWGLAETGGLSTLQQQRWGGAKKAVAQQAKPR
uniref:Uncharacterized protein n=1 Tax=Globodera rostochiensis TaxID=31243 RepID=A0A914HIU8_GLORO